MMIEQISPTEENGFPSWENCDFGRYGEIAQRVDLALRSLENQSVKIRRVVRSNLNSGICRIGNGWTLFLEQTLSPIEQLEVIAESARTLHAFRVAEEAQPAQPMQLR